MRRIEIRKGEEEEEEETDGKTHQRGGKKRREGERGFFNLFCLCYELGERVRRGGGRVVCFQGRYASGGQRGKQCERLAPAEGEKTHIRAAGLQ